MPIISAQVTCVPNSPAVATIQIPPLSAATQFHPRTMVHLFFLDLYKGAPALNVVKPKGGDQRGERNPSLSDMSDNRKRTADDARDTENSLAAGRDLDNNNWRLLFGGEVVGFAWTKNATQRSLVLQCEDWSNYWDYAFQADNTDIFGPGIKAVFSGASTNLFTDFLSTKGTAITGIVSSGRCNTFPALKGLAAGIIRLIEAIGGSYYVYPNQDKNKTPKRYAGSNIFFSYNELRLHLTQLVGTVAEDPTGQRILSRQGYSGMFDRLLGGQGGQVSIRQAITALTKIMFYEMYPQACPLYKPGTYGEVSGTRRVKLKDHPVFGKFASVASSISANLGRAITDLETLSKADASAPNASQDLKAAATAEALWLSGAAKELRKARAQMQGVPENVTKAFTFAATAVGKATNAVSSLLAPPSAKGNAAATQAKKIAAAVTNLTNAIVALGTVSEAVALLGSANDRFPAQVYQQVFKPDTWFAAPIRCNVLFPENYDMLSYQRMFLREPTRFMLKTNDEFFGEDELFDHFYFAPKANSVHGSKLNMQSILKRDLLDHERFTGILPIFEKMGEFNVFASRAEAKDNRPGIQKIGLAQRSANFLYFRHRFNARQMVVSGKFNPYVAVGFPGLIIDKYVDTETVARHNALRREVNAQNPDGSFKLPEVALSDILGTNFLGNFTQVMHQVSQDQPMGKTDITVTFPRQPEESVEFLGAIPEDLRVRRKLDGSDAVRSTDVASISPPAVFSLGPNSGRIIGVQDVTQVHDVSRGVPTWGNARSLPVFLTGDRRESFSPPSVPIGVPVVLGTLGSSLLVQEFGDGNPNTIVVFRAYRLTEEIPRYKREDALLPAEEYIRPGWYGPLWTNSKIGDVYKELMGTGSITDPQVVNDFGRDSASLHNDEAEKAAADQQNAADADDPRRDAPAVLDLREGSSIQQAVEFLHLTYSYIRRAGLDVDEFIGSYTWRPIVSMLDMFGTGDLAYSTDGEMVVSGFEGFHSRAIGPYENLFGLVSAELESVVGIKRGSTAASRLDTRLAKREQVEKYVAQLLFSNAVLG